jgi:leader peptidase (prepilin peptidase)/N-methyltransferase
VTFSLANSMSGAAADDVRSARSGFVPRSGVLAGSAVHGGSGSLRTCGRRATSGILRDGVALGIVSGVLAGLVGVRLGASLVLPAFWAPAALAGPLACTDLLRRRLPYALVVPLYVIGGVTLVAAAVSLGNVGSLASAVGAAVAATVVFLAVALVFPGQLGLGDVVLVGALALSLGWLGWPKAITGLMIGLLLGAGPGLVLAVARRSPKRVVLPLGPALLTGWLVVVLW